MGRQSDEGEVTSIKILSSSTLINCSHFTVISNDQLTTCVNTVSALYCHQYLFCLAGQNCIMHNCIMENLYHVDMLYHDMLYHVDGTKHKDCFYTMMLIMPRM